MIAVGRALEWALLPAADNLLKMLSVMKASVGLQPFRGDEDKLIYTPVFSRAKTVTNHECGYFGFSDGVAFSAN